MDVAAQVCAGLAVAHRQGVVHRDLKPHNIMLEARTGRVVVMDFGIARAAELAGKTAEHVSGTPEYMAPEQVRGREVDARADLYALGCVMYEMLTGKRIFPKATGLAAAVAHADDPAPALAPTFPAQLARVVARLLEKDPRNRFDDAAQVAGALVAPPRRRWGWLAAGAVVAAGAIALLVARGRSPRRWQAQIRELPVYVESSDAPAISPDGEQVAYMSDREEPFHYRIYVARLAGGAPRAITSRDLGATWPRWTRDGKALLFIAGQAAYRVPLEDGAPELIAEGVTWVEDCAGRLLLIYEGSQVCPRCERFVLRESDGQERDVLRLPASEHVLSPRCDGEGRHALYSVAELPGSGWPPQSDLWTVALDGGSPRRLTNDHAANAGAFASGGRSIVYSATHAGESHLWERSVDGAAAPIQLTFGQGYEYTPDVSRDGRVVLYNVDQTFSQLFAEPLDGGPRRKLTANLATITRPRPTPDGSAIIFSLKGPALRMQIASVPVDGGEPVILTDGEIPALTPAGDEVLYNVSGTGRVEAVPRNGGASRPITFAPGLVIRIEVGPDSTVHLMIARPQGDEAWRAPLAGGAAERELPAPWSFLYPAPRGGWRAALESRANRHRVHVLRPDAPIDDASGRTLDDVDWGYWMPDGLSLLYLHGERVHRFFVETGEDRELPTQASGMGLAVSPDGKTLYGVDEVSQVRREIITNFADRPR